MTEIKKHLNSSCPSQRSAKPNLPCRYRNRGSCRTLCKSSLYFRDMRASFQGVPHTYHWTSWHHIGSGRRRWIWAWLYDGKDQCRSCTFLVWYKKSEAMACGSNSLPFPQVSNTETSSSSKSLNSVRRSWSRTTCPKSRLNLAYIFWYITIRHLKRRGVDIPLCTSLDPGPRWERRCRSCQYRSPD